MSGCITCGRDPKRVAELELQVINLTEELALLKSERDAAVVKALEEVISGIRRMKYSDRGEGPEDMDPHCDDHPDYERAMLDEFAEEIVAAIRSAAEAREGKDDNA